MSSFGQFSCRDISHQKFKDSYTATKSDLITDRNQTVNKDYSDLEIIATSTSLDCFLSNFDTPNKEDTMNYKTSLPLQLDSSICSKNSQSNIFPRFRYPERRNQDELTIFTPNIVCNFNKERFTTIENRYTATVK